MKITEILEEDLVISDLKASNKRGVLVELSNVLVNHHKLADLETIVKILLEREKLGSTGIGDGIAIPHGKLDGIDKLYGSFGRSIKGIDFQSIDEKPAHLFFLLIAPKDSAGIHLKALARISRLLKDESFRKKLMKAKDRRELFNIIKEEDEKY
ncbi:MAG: PTS sugar transporter subunit IIA [Deltaproteobacteria bacterium]|nr:PTS sugar transporter subunit IIA [Deltaproteobacteria bacterium]